MTRFHRASLFLILAPLYALPSLGQDLPSDEQILANLRFQIPELREANLVMQPMVASAFEGFHQGAVVVNESQQLHFLIADKTAHVLLLLSPVPIDVGLSPDQLAALQEEEDQAAKVANEERHQALLRFSEGMSSRGPSDAPVTIFEFSDFQCPYCARGFSTIEEVLELYPDKVRFVYLHLPLPNHNWAKPAAIAAVCAADQADRAFWMLHDGYFRNQSQVSLGNVIELSQSYLDDSGIDMDVWTKCASDRNSADYMNAAAKVEASIASAESVFGVSGTPGFFVNGQFLNGAHPVETFEALIEELSSSQISQ